MSDRLPYCSVVIPTHNRPAQLASCLAALAAVDYPRERFEVVVADDGSATCLEAVVAPFDRQLELTLIRQRRAGPAGARNNGARHARGELLAFTDDDCAPAPGWLRAFAAQWSHTPENAMGGHTTNALAANPYSSASQRLLHYLYDYYNADPERARFFAANNFAIPARGFREIGGFDERLTRAAAEDRELCDRWLALGKQMTYVEKARVQHSHRMGLRGFCRQHFNYGRGAHYVHRTRAALGRGGWQLEPPRFYFGMAGYAAGGAPPAQACALLLLIGLSQAANAGGFFCEAISRQLRRTAPAPSRPPPRATLDELLSDSPARVEEPAPTASRQRK